MAEEAFSGSFDSLLVAFAPTDSLKTTEGSIFYQTETPPNYPITECLHFSHFALGSSSLISTPLVCRRIICSAKSMMREAAASVLTPRR